MPSDRPTDIDIVYRCVYSSRRRQTHTTHTTERAQLSKLTFKISISNMCVCVCVRWWKGESLAAAAAAVFL